MPNPDEMTADELRQFEEERVHGRDDEPVNLPASEADAPADDHRAEPHAPVLLPPD